MAGIGTTTSGCREETKGKAKQEDPYGGDLPLWLKIFLSFTTSVPILLILHSAEDRKHRQEG